MDRPSSESFQIKPAPASTCQEGKPFRPLNQGWSFQDRMQQTTGQEIFPQESESGISGWMVRRGGIAYLSNINLKLR